MPRGLWFSLRQAADAAIETNVPVPAAGRAQRLRAGLSGCSAPGSAAAAHRLAYVQPGAQHREAQLIDGYQAGHPVIIDHDSKQLATKRRAAEQRAGVRVWLRKVGRRYRRGDLSDRRRGPVGSTV